MLKQIEDIRAENDRRFTSQEKAVETAFAASKEAITKSEIAVEKRSDAVYVTITKLQDALAAVMPRAEAEQRFNSLTEKLSELNTYRSTTEGQDKGKDKTWAVIITIIGVGIAIIGFLGLK